MYNLSVEGLIWRFYLMMLVVILAIFCGYSIFALIALPVFLSGMFGMRFTRLGKQKTENIKGKEKPVSAVAE